MAAPVISESKAIDWSQLKPGSMLLGVDAHGPVEVIASSQVAGTSSFNVVYRRSDGTTGIFVADEKTANISLLEKSLTRPSRASASPATSTAVGSM